VVLVMNGKDRHFPDAATPVVSQQFFRIFAYLICRAG
jgi:hypothetical protein